MASDIYETDKTERGLAAFLSPYLAVFGICKMVESMGAACLPLTGGNQIAESISNSLDLQLLSIPLVPIGHVRLSNLQEPCICFVPNVFDDRQLGQDGTWDHGPTRTSKNNLLLLPVVLGREETATLTRPLRHELARCADLLPVSRTNLWGSTIEGRTVDKPAFYTKYLETGEAEEESSSDAYCSDHAKKRDTTCCTTHSHASLNRGEESAQSALSSPSANFNRPNEVHPDVWSTLGETGDRRSLFCCFLRRQERQRMKNAVPSTGHGGHVAVAAVDPGSWGPGGIEFAAFLGEIRRIARRQTGSGERAKDSQQAQGLGGGICRILVESWSRPKLQLRVVPDGLHAARRAQRTE
ncbi:hypothetical protein FALBO_2425 [Fusarium albosuccineum]|uniref:Uncharacterized protein n=1 Tax=Fusarium albosuccineum TaxID=1237068 RepID=A0A8H4LN69_9HYPO|nr:hypothetical protein FALBO_2425 [Fusarium albosuccineum]